MSGRLNLRIVFYALSLLLLGSLWGVAVFNGRSIYLPHEPSPASGSLRRFSSEDELKAFLNRSYPGGPIFYGSLDGQVPRGMGSPYEMSAGAMAEPKASDYSGTNIQVEGVDEADMVKTDGRYIYIVADGSIIIVKAYPPETAEALSRISLNRSVGEIFLYGDKLAVLLIEGAPHYAFTSKRLMAPRLFEASTVVKIFDISDRSHPSEERSIEVDGYYVDSRMIGEHIYLVTGMPAHLKAGEVVLPKIRSRDLAVTIPASSIYYANYTDYSYVYTNILSMSISDPSKPLNHESFLVGAASCIYVSADHIYIAVPRCQYTGTRWFEETSIYKIGVDDGKILYATDGVVPGRVLNQFSMDEFEGYLRIATTTGRYWGGVRPGNNVYILNSSLGVVGRLEGLAPGEEIYSARFMGSRGYLVTFKKVDPLFVLDLNEPKNPRILGRLKIPGYSNYLHPIDENHLIGIGKEASEAEGGEFAWYRGVKISLFDVSDLENPKELARYVVGDRGTDSPVLRDHKALLFVRSMRVLVLPILEAKIDPGAYPGGVPPNAQGEYVYQGAYAFRISQEEGIELIGRITHMDDPEEQAMGGLRPESPYHVKRALYIEDILYTISNRVMKMNSLETLKEIKRVILS
jgi:inhibitor of cysteine peptidase